MMYSLEKKSPNEKASNKRVQRTSHKVRRPLTRDVQPPTLPQINGAIETTTADRENNWEKTALCPENRRLPLKTA